MKHLALSLLLALPACFTGASTIGSVCRVNAECGAEQTCERGFCSNCDDGVSEAGEVCLEAVASSLPTADVFAVADFDENGRGDLLVESGTARSLVLGTSTGFETTVLPAAATAHRLFIPGDVDGDEHTDIVGLAADGSTGTVFFGDGLGGLTELDVPLLAQAVDVRILGGTAIWAAVGERVATLDVRARGVVAGPEVPLGEAVQHLVGPVLLNADDRADVIAVLTTGRVVVLTGTEAGGLDPLEGAGFSAPALDTWLTDVNGDGRLELLGLLTGEVEVITSGEDGTFSPGFTFPTVPGATSIAVFDVNADLARDVLVFGGEPGLAVHTGLLRGFEPAVALLAEPVLLEVTQLLVGDDLYPDLLLAPVGGPITLLEATP